MDCQEPNTVYLTFDDGPHSNTRRILNVLNDYGAKATFFVVGRNAKHQPHLVRAIVDEGHDVGNHSYSHPNLHKLSGSDAKGQIEQTQSVLAHILGDQISLVRWWRAPYGNYVPMKVGLTHMLWSIDTHDYLKPQPQRMMDQVLARVRHKSVVLMHDHSTSTMAGLEYLVNALDERGYTLAGLSSFDLPTCERLPSPPKDVPPLPQPSEHEPEREDEVFEHHEQNPREPNVGSNLSDQQPEVLQSSMENLDTLNPSSPARRGSRPNPAFNQASHVKWED